MKFFATLAIAAVAVNAVAVPEPDPWCRKPGQPCWKDKRAAEAEPWCRKPGQPCWKVKRAALALHTTLTELGEEEEDGKVEKRSPEALLSHSKGGAAYMAKRGLDELANVVAAAQDDPLSYYENLKMDKRFAEDTASVERREADPWCRGMSEECRNQYKTKKPVEGGDDSEKEQEQQEEEEVDVDLHGEEKRWCRKPGQPCWKVRRAAEAVAEAIGEPTEGIATRDFNPVSKREPEPWCRKPGQPCWKRNADPEPWCRKPGQPCWKAARDLHAMQNVARSLIESLQ